MKTSVRKVVYTTLVGTMLGILPLSLQAQNTPMRGPIPFSHYDQNKDGLITKKEFNDMRSKRMQERAESGRPMRNAANAPEFSYFDANNDGKITKQELLEGQNKRMQERRGGGMGMGMGKGPNR